MKLAELVSVDEGQGADLLHAFDAGDASDGEVEGHVAAVLLLGQDLGVAWVEIRDNLQLLLVDYMILAGAVAVMFVVGLLRERQPDRPLRVRLDERPYLMRGGLIFLCALAVIVFGAYGWKYNAMDFVYMQF